MNAQLRRAYLRGFLEKTAQWQREPWQQRLQAELNAGLPIVEPLGEDHNRSVAEAVKARADQQAAAKARVKAYFDGRANLHENYGMGRIIDSLVKAEPASGGLPAVPPGPYKVRAEQEAAAKAKATAAKTKAPDLLATVKKFLADNKTGIGIGTGVVGGGYLALKIKKMLDERRRRRRRREEENTALMHAKYAQAATNAQADAKARADQRAATKAKADKQARAPAPRSPVYTPSLESVISGVTANRAGKVQLEAERQRLSSVNKARARRQVEESSAASRDFEAAAKQLKRTLSREQFDAVKPAIRERSQSLKNTADLRKDQYKIENPGWFDRMAVNLFGSKEDANIKREARKLVASGVVPAVPGPGPGPGPGSGSGPGPASGANPESKLTDTQKALGVAALLGVPAVGYGAYRMLRPKPKKRRSGADEEGLA